MESRYLYRGKRIENGEWNGKWVEGHYYEFMGKSYIFEQPFTSGNLTYEVDPSTICQCTGLKDDDGTLIFENDIVKDKNGNLYKAFWQDNYYQFSWICIKSNSLPVGAKWDFYSIKSFEIEVIGNNFDNPELLEV